MRAVHFQKQYFQFLVRFPIIFLENQAMSMKLLMTNEKIVDISWKMYCSQNIPTLIQAGKFVSLTKEHVIFIDEIRILSFPFIA